MLTTAVETATLSSSVGVVLHHLHLLRHHQRRPQHQQQQYQHQGSSSEPSHQRESSESVDGLRVDIAPFRHHHQRRRRREQQQQQQGGRHREGSRHQHKRGFFATSASTSTSFRFSASTTSSPALSSVLFWTSLLLLLLMAPCFTAGQGLAGSVTKCKKEGEEVIIPGITDDPCISCKCKNLQVECEKVRCLKLEGCHAILFGLPNDRCCELCKGCKANGTEYRSGDIWSDPSDPCQRRHCKAGVITESTEQCFSHCHSPVPMPGQCCPVCQGCVFRGQKHQEGDKFTLPADPCTQCVCQNGSISCSKKSCPVLNCHKSVIYQPKGECCPACKGMRRIFDVPSRCYFAKKIYRRGQMFQPDSCTKCTCISGTAQCSRVTCPALDCPPEERSRSEDGCCEICPVRRHCTHHGAKRAHKEEWMVSSCMTCSCDNGVTYCQRERCSNSLWCPQGFQLRLTKDACCPKCVEHDAVCTVFGDPHYRTFDGRMFNFQGGCKYLLVRDCHRHSFTIKVRNGVRFNSGFAWTQMLAVFIGNSRISLLQNLRVKVNRKRVRLPYASPTGGFSIRRTGNSVRLRSQLGVDVVWDGDSFLEVTVSSDFKNRLCGLCGNYNGLKSDDLTGSDGRLHADEEEFGNSWRIGSVRACKVNPRVDTRPLCDQDAKARQRANRVCSVLYEHSLQACRSILPVERYVRSCITDMCDCPPGRYCACEALKAYLSQCQRAGVRIPRGRHRKCFPPVNCPADAKTVLCSDTCPRTCANLNSVQPCPSVCDEGCLCDDGKVLHDDACIGPEFCPAAAQAPPS